MRSVMEREQIREVCTRHGLAVTRQREVLLEVMASMHGHPSPEEVFARVRERIPTISLATVYKNLHLFVESGVLRDVSMHHGSRRVEMNREEHHHLVCSRCKSITDLHAEDLHLVPHATRLPDGFLVERLAVDVIGLCAACQAEMESTRNDSRSPESAGNGIEVQPSSLKQTA